MNKFESEMASLNTEAAQMNESREQGLIHCRKLIQLSSKAIRCIHRQEFLEADKFLAIAKQTMTFAQEMLSPHPELYYANYLPDSQKEYVEAKVMMAISQGESIPSKNSLGVGLFAYLHGLTEAASEARRSVLDKVRKSEVTEGLRILEQMELIYDELIAFDYPDGMTHNLRRSVDSLRAVLERTRSDLSVTLSQIELLQELKKSQNKFPDGVASS